MTERSFLERSSDCFGKTISASLIRTNTRELKQPGPGLVCIFSRIIWETWSFILISSYIIKPITGIIVEQMLAFQSPDHQS